MADNTVLPGTGEIIAADDIAGVKYQIVKIGHSAADAAPVHTSATNPLPVALIGPTGLTDTQLRATAVPVSGTVAVSNMVAQGLTDTQLRATALPVSGTVAVSNMVAQGLTDTQIRATALPVSGTFFQPTQPVSGTVNAAAGGVNNSARGDGFLRVSLDPTTIIIDAFDAVIDTTNTWTASATAPTLSAGNVSFPVGIAASAASHLTSKGSGIQGASGYLVFASMATLPAAAETNSKRYLGLVNMAGTPTAAIPFVSAAVFEAAEDGLFYGAAYSNGARTFAVALTRPTDGAAHRFAIYYKTSKIYFEIDGVIVGTLSSPNISGAIFSLGAGVINGTTAPAAQPTFTVSILSMGDTGRNNTKISDGLFPWRQATIKPGNTIAATTDTAMVVTQHPNSSIKMTAVTPATILSVANTTATLNIPAPAAGLFHYITRIRITLHNTSATAVAGSAVTLGFTSTNLPGTLAWTDGNALAAGTSKTVVDEQLSSAIKATLAATATTIVAPAAGAGVQCRITAYFYTGP